MRLFLRDCLKRYLPLLKPNLVVGLQSKSKQFDVSMVKPGLLNIVPQHRSSFDYYKIDQLAKDHRHIVLRLPPYHCELNPIELIWANIKGNVATFKFKDMNNLFASAIVEIDQTNWKNCN